MTNARDLSNRLAALLRREQHAMADFLLALAQFDRLRAWEQLGHASLFAFLRRELRLSAGAAQYRKTAAELIRRHPEVEAALRSGELCLSSIVELAKVLTAENAAGVLPRFFGLSRRDAADVAVSIRPVSNPPRREVVTAVRSGATDARASGPVSAGAFAGGGRAGGDLLRPAEPDRARLEAPTPPLASPAEALRPAEVDSTRALAGAREPAPATTVEPLDAELVRLHLTVSRRLLAKLAAAKDALSHARPGATSEEILETALDLLLQHHAKRKAAAVTRPRAAAPTPRSAAQAGAPLPTDRNAADPTSRHVPAAVRREVWTRDQGRCRWPLEAGGICGSTHRLELDHVTPVALGGPSTVGNLRVLCERHNKLAARRALGDACMDRFAGDRARSRRPTPASPEARSYGVPRVREPSLPFGSGS